MQHPPEHRAPSRYTSHKGLKKLLAALRVTAALAIPALLLVALQRASIDQPLKEGDPAPDLDLPGLEGGTISLRNLHAQPLAVMFFSADCPHCKQELQSMHLLHRTLNDRIRFLLISESQDKKARHLLDSLGIRMRTALDLDGRARAAFKAFRIPALFLIRPGGTIHQSLVGDWPPGTCKAHIESFLESVGGNSNSSDGSLH